MNTTTMTTKYLYEFDVPGTSDSCSGYIELCKNKIVLVIPETQESKLDACFQNIALYIDGQLKYSSQWLPTYSYNDFYKLKDMMTTCYYTFLTLSNLQSPFNASSYTPWYFKNCVTSYVNECLEINCFEDMYNTCIQITCSNSNTVIDMNNSIIDIEIYIGINKIFCGRDLYNKMTSVNMYNYAMDFILYKLIKYI